MLRASQRRSLADESIRTFVDAIVFNWLIAGTDAHAKNYALLLSGSQVRLAPFYDIASALPYPHLYRPKLKLAMKIGGYYGVEQIAVNAWRRFADDVHIDADALVTRINELATHLPDALASACADPDVAALMSDLPARLVDAVNARVGRCRL